mmetsp:Transcript_58266/g.103452  ORF Transcript_58266/g.103452 Transcript_58266/m.103452 type:complete len:175 (-) Transcript_58266:56-580(-)
MFNCRICSENPFAAFGGDPPKQEKDSSRKKKTRSRGSRSEESWTARSDAEVKAAVSEWMKFVHPRAQEVFTTKEALEEVLVELAKGTDRTSDPVLDDGDVIWYGDITKDDTQAAIRIVKPGDSEASVSYVNRILPFIFATDESFEQLEKLPKVPFKMSCGNQLCIALAHISLQR